MRPDCQTGSSLAIMAAFFDDAWLKVNYLTKYSKYYEKSVVSGYKSKRIS